MNCAVSSFAIGARLENECVDSTRFPVFGGSKNTSFDADALPGRQEIPSLFGDVIAVLTDPASGCIDRLRACGNVPEQATKSPHEFAPDVRIDR